jgi:hypothetical protein
LDAVAMVIFLSVENQKDAYVKAGSVPWGSYVLLVVCY